MYINFMKDLNENTLPASEAGIKFRDTGYISLTKKASSILGLDGYESFVKIKKDDDGRVYIGKSRDNGYRFHRRNSQYVFWSKSVARSLADALKGYGTYRIEEESPVKDFMNNEYYTIFWKNYEK